jgi:hypothetical protein
MVGLVPRPYSSVSSVDSANRSVIVVKVKVVRLSNLHAASLLRRNYCSSWNAENCSTHGEKISRVKIPGLYLPIPVRAGVKLPSSMVSEMRMISASVYHDFHW